MRRVGEGNRISEESQAQGAFRRIYVFSARLKIRRALAGIRFVRRLGPSRVA
jgi:hypothetical protein